MNRGHGRRCRFIGAALPITFALAAAAISGQAAASGGSGGSFCGLGDLPGGIFYSEANAVSADGTVVVGASRSAGGTEAFAWRGSSGPTGLGDLAGGSFFSRALGVSANGRVVVGESASANGNEAFVWSRVPGMTGIGDLDGGDFASTASGASRGGSVVVGTGLPDEGVEHAFRWTPAEGLVRLTEDESVFLSDASGVSADGSGVVGQALIDSTFEAYRWTAAEGIRGIGELPGGSVYSAALAVSMDGSVVVGESSSDLGNEAFLWTSRTGMTGLGDLPGGAFISRALAVSADGAVVVGSGFTDEGPEAFVWDASNGIRSLKDVIGAETGADLSGWTLSDATGVSADGTVIVGNGTNPAGRSEGWIARLACASSILAGRVNTGDGSPPAPVFSVNGSVGNACREVFVPAGVPVPIGIANAPSVAEAGQYAMWLYEGAPTAGVAAAIRFQSLDGTIFDLGSGPRLLPVNNTEIPGVCPCPLAFPVGRTSKPLGAARAALLCLNARPAHPRSPTSFMQAFPAGDFTLGGVVLDRNSVRSPEKNASIGNWIVVRSR